jgi:hypothetical protein
LGYFIQFEIIFEKKEILLDIPLVELSDEQVEDLKDMLDVDVAIDSFTGEQMSIQKLFYPHEMKKISRIVDNILLQVFNIPASYDILIEMFS